MSGLAGAAMASFLCGPLPCISDASDLGGPCRVRSRKSSAYFKATPGDGVVLDSSLRQI